MRKTIKHPCKVYLEKNGKHSTLVDRKTHHEQDVPIRLFPRNTEGDY